LSDYWFARRYPIGSGRNSVSPVSREGRLVFVYWAAAMFVGALVWAFLAWRGVFFGGLIVYVVVVLLACWLLFTAILRKTDHARTVDDYRRIQARGNP
jgi:fatty acid desaturase